MPAVTRIGDADVTHCSGMTRAQGSSNVFANGIAVFVNSKGCGRVGDGISGCTSVAAGSSNVFAGG